MKNKRRMIILFSITTLLLLPLIAMQFTDEVNWGPLDFIVAAVLLFGTALLFEIVLSNVRNQRIRIAMFVAILATLFLLWAELAVGIFGTSISGQ